MISTQYTTTTEKQRSLQRPVLSIIHIALNSTEQNGAEAKVREQRLNIGVRLLQVLSEELATLRPYLVLFVSLFHNHARFSFCISRLDR